MKKLANVSLILVLIGMATACDTIINHLLGDEGSSRAYSVLYVAPVSQGYGDGTSWANASSDLQVMIHIASNPQNYISAIWVQAGTYTPSHIPPGSGTTTPRDRTFFLREGVKIYGGFEGTETSFSQRDIANNESILSGDFNDDDSGAASTNNSTMSENAYHVVLGRNLTRATVLDGLTISGGNADGSVASGTGGGLYNKDSSPTLTNVTISGNAAKVGGGINNDNSSPTLTNVTISDNAVTVAGGGINNDNSSPTLTNVTISHNTANSSGGGIYNSGTTVSLTFTNVTISDNTASDGGGLYNSDSSLTFTNVVISDNVATSAGGGIFNTGTTVSLTFTNVVISGNTAPAGGGLLSNSGDSPLIFTNVTISGNTASGAGAGLYLTDTFSLILTNAIISGNTVGSSGGGIYFSTGSIALTNVTISGNTAGGYGGGMYISGGSTVLTNVTVSGNYANNAGGGIYGTSGNISASIIWGNATASNTDPNVQGFTATFTNSLVQGAIAANWAGFGTDGGGNIDVVDPLFEDPIPASSTPTTLGDYRLQSGSPAAGRGSNYFGN